MWLVLADPGDLGALWAYRGLLSLGLSPIELVSAEKLCYWLRFEHRLGSWAPTVEIILADGLTISATTVTGVLNRVAALPSAHLARVSPRDRLYAAQELSALFLSWLSALPGPVVNRPTPMGLAGRSLPASEWTWLAARAGLSTVRYRETGSGTTNVVGMGSPLPGVGPPLRTVFVVGGEIVGNSPPPGVAHGCRRLGELADTTLLGVQFGTGEAGPWTFAAADVLPDLRPGGTPLLAALASALGKEPDR